VLKQINISVLSEKEQRECIGEVQLLASVDSPYVVRYYDSFIEEGSLHIIMEYCARGDLHQRLRVSAEARCTVAGQHTGGPHIPGTEEASR
jgi:NIMA (never in mitosis gene a)-related kinase